MNQKEAALASCIVATWPFGLGDFLFGACRLPVPAPGVRAKFRLPATDIAWREFDLITEEFHADGKKCRLVVELKNGGIGYRSMGQVIFYKHVLASRHSALLGADRLVFVAIGASPSQRRWSGKGVLESDAEVFLQLLRSEYWPDPDIHVLSHEQLGLTWSKANEQWLWRAA